MHSQPIDRARPGMFRLCHKRWKGVHTVNRLRNECGWAHIGSDTCSREMFNGIGLASSAIETLCPLVGGTFWAPYLSTAFTAHAENKLPAIFYNHAGVE